MTLPDKNGHFGIYGGKYVPETLIPALEELEYAYKKYKNNSSFKKELAYYLKYYAGRPNPLYFAERLTKLYGRGKIYLKREDLNHTGAHKINNTLGQILLAKKMGKKRIIAETGAGQHGVATATVCSLFGMECVVYMGEEDMKRQALNVFRMELLGTKVKCVTSGSKTLKDATSQTIRDWMANVRNTHYIIGSTVGPHPYPMIVRDFQAIIGEEVKKQLKQLENKSPNYLVACVGGGSNSLGLFYPFINNKKVKMIGVEAAGYGLKTTKHAAPLAKGKPGVLHGSYSYVLQNYDGQITTAHSISAGLDYPGVGPEHSILKDTKRVNYVCVTDKEAVDAFLLTSKLEGLIPALESAHAIAYLNYLMPKTKKSDVIVVCLSGRGDKDVESIRDYLNKHAKK